MDPLQQIIDSYNATASLDRAYTIPAAWYVNKDLYNLELRTVFTNNWHLAARRDQLEKPGQYVTTDIGSEPIVVVRDSDDVLRHSSTSAVITPPLS